MPASRRLPAVAAIPIAIGLALAGCDSSAGSNDDKPPPASVASGDGDAVARWYAGGGDTLTTAFGADLARISADSGRGDTAAMGGDCESLVADVGAAENYPAIPDGEAQQHWSAALEHLRDGGTDCARGAKTGDAAMLASSGADIRTAGAEMRQATARVNVLLAGSV